MSATVGCPYLRGTLCGGIPGSSFVCVRDVGDDTMHWKYYGRNTTQVGPQADGAVILDRGLWWLGLSPAGGIYHVGMVTGGEDIRLPLPEHSHTFHCNQAHYVPVSGGG